MPNFIEIEETSCGWTDVWTEEHIETHFIRSTQKSRPENEYFYPVNVSFELRP